MWRRHAQKVSVADDKIYRELHKKELGKHLHAQQGFTFDREEDGVAGTWADLYYAGPYRLAIFIDGLPLHSKHRQSVKDQLVVKALEQRGFRVKRFSYKPPLSKKRLKEIVDDIRYLLLSFE